jgi:ABC-2 type transport system ATP-binding protein
VLTGHGIAIADDGSGAAPSAPAASALSPASLAAPTAKTGIRHDRPVTRTNSTPKQDKQGKVDAALSTNSQVLQRNSNLSAETASDVTSKSTAPHTSTPRGAINKVTQPSSKSLSAETISLGRADAAHTFDSVKTHWAAVTPVTGTAASRTEPAAAVVPVLATIAPIDKATTTATLSLVAAAVSALLDPGSPSSPTDSAAEWAVAAVARRELSAGPIIAAPTVGLTNAVITGSVGGSDATGNKLTYSVVGKPDAGGKITLNASSGTFTFLPDESVVNSRGVETFTVNISETTAFVATLEKIPVLGGLVQPIVVILRQIPVVNNLLKPLIGISVTVPVAVDVSQVVPEGTPIAFTTKVASFDGTLISVNFFPALGLTADAPAAPTIFDGPGLASAGDTDPNSTWINDLGLLFPGIAPLRAEGYNVVTWDPRGEYASGGVLQLDNPKYEGRDVSAIIDWVAQRPEAELDSTDDPRMGMVGFSYGGGIQLVTAAIDHRVDAIVPGIAWNSLNSALYNNGTFRTAYGTFLTLALALTGGRINPEIYLGELTGSLLGLLTPDAQNTLTSSGPGDLINDITAPTLLLQGTVDVLFTLQQAITNAQMLNANGVPVKMVWYCGGHGDCLTPNDGFVAAINATMNWLDRYVKGDKNVDTGAKFEWIDQNGDDYASDFLPSDGGFHGIPIVATGSGGGMVIIPALGGSGPSKATLPFGFAEGSRAPIAINTTVSSGVATQIVGSPEVTITYSGLGTSSHIYAQLIDNNTGLVVGNLVTPVSVRLDGQVHTVTVQLEAIAQTMAAGDSLTLQLVGSATAYENLTSFGFINVTSVGLSLPTVAAGVATKEDETLVAA